MYLSGTAPSAAASGLLACGLCITDTAKIGDDFARRTLDLGLLSVDDVSHNGNYCEASPSRIEGPAGSGKFAVVQLETDLLCMTYPREIINQISVHCHKYLIIGMYELSGTSCDVLLPIK